MTWLARLLRRSAGPSVGGATGDSIDAASAHVDAGNALLDRDLLDEACEQFRLAAESDPRRVAAHVNLAFTLIERGLVQEALAPLRRALALSPESHDAHYLMARVLLAQRAHPSAIHHLERAIHLKPDLLMGYRDLGRALHEIGDHARAKSILRAGLGIEPRFADLHYFLGNIQAHEMAFDEALASYRQALAIQPDYAAVYSNMAPALLNLADFEGAAAAARAALAIDPSMHHARSNLLIALSCDARCSPDDYLTEARSYGQILTAQTASLPLSRRRAPNAEIAGPPRRLRIGFVSGDLRSHPVGYFLENVLAHWDSLGMEPIAYSNHASHDDLTARLEGRFCAWRDISTLGDAAAARQIESDGIDVLVDLSGHTADNRLPLFARRPAPVQVSWLGYWASTGLPTMDYLLADPISVPPEHHAHFTETIWYLPDTRLCFTPPAGPDVSEVTGLPALRTGHITFGSFQRLTKLTDAVLQLWAQVLRAVPDARLRLQSAQLNDAACRARLTVRLAAAGIDTARVRFAGGGPRAEYLAAHAEVDILLDTFPHSGATTTCEALWMGVPTLTLAGATMVARQGASLLKCAGLGDWVASNENDYVALAVRHANDLEALARLRSALRQRALESRLFDAATFTRLFQNAMRDMWERGLVPDA
ncbi:MAG: tetratricopeptide repeat protein [Pseudomonadota bacterium]